MTTMLFLYFFLSCWSAGTYISCGLGEILSHHILISCAVVPMLLIGGLYGRIIGRALVDYYGIQEDKYWVAGLVLIMTHVTLIALPRLGWTQGPLRCSDPSHFLPVHFLSRTVGQSKVSLNINLLLSFQA